MDEYAVYSSIELQLSDSPPLMPMDGAFDFSGLGQVLFQLLTLRGFAAAIQSFEHEKETTRGGRGPAWLVLAKPVIGNNVETSWNLIWPELT